VIGTFLFPGSVVLLGQRQLLDVSHVGEGSSHESSFVSSGGYRTAFLFPLCTQV
jgi:hypothetical protein